MITIPILAMAAQDAPLTQIITVLAGLQIAPSILPAGTELLNHWKDVMTIIHLPMMAALKTARLKLTTNAQIQHPLFAPRYVGMESSCLERLVMIITQIRTMAVLQIVLLKLTISVITPLHQFAPRFAGMDMLFLEKLAMIITLIKAMDALIAQLSKIGLALASLVIALKHALMEFKMETKLVIKGPIQPRHALDVKFSMDMFVLDGQAHAY